MLKIVAVQASSWSINALAQAMYLSPSEFHAALGRSEKARLFDADRRLVRTLSLEDFLLHGVHYVFFAVKGEITRGVPTSIAGPPLVQKHFDEPEIPAVWPHPMGLKRGYALEPLYKRAPDGAVADTAFYELLALTDALREGSPRVRGIAVAEIKPRLDAYARFAGIQQ